MKKFSIMVDTYATSTYEVLAETEDEAREKVQEIIDGENFFEEYRKNCEFFEPTQSDVIDSVIIPRRISIDNGATFIEPEEALDRMPYAQIENFMDEEVVAEILREPLAPCTQIKFLKRYLELAKADLIVG